MQGDVELLQIQHHNDIQGNRIKTRTESSPVHRNKLSQINNQLGMSGDNDIKHTDVKPPDIGTEGSTTKARISAIRTHRGDINIKPRYDLWAIALSLVQIIYIH